MCGIAGWIDWKTDISNHQLVLKRMADTLANRGPDNEGIWISHCAGFAHRRLVVIDPAGGCQPMIRTHWNHKYVITYNGELYNTPELRKALQEKGYKFLDHSDTEVLLISYIEWGEKCVEYFNGIYAFGIWDDEKESLFLARDRMGVKPLFYTQQDSNLIFGSELKTLLAHPSIEAIIDSNGLSEIFLIGPSRTPGCGVFKNIFELRPGYCLTYNRNGLKTTQYWSLESKAHTDDFDTTTEKVRGLVLDAIKRQLVADVPICTFLSGGLDSSTISAVASKAFAEKELGQLHTYSIDYVDNDKYFKPSVFQPNSDAHWVKIVSDALGSQHQYMMFDSPQLVQSLQTAMLARDLPGMADVDSSLYLFCHDIKKEATVALSGECADEVFGGYPWYYREEMLNTDTFPWSTATKERAGLLSQKLLSKLNPEDYVRTRYDQTLAEVTMHEDDSSEQKRMREMFYLNLKWFMTTLLDRKDRMSMATGLEVRVPFCDHRIVEYMWNVPWEMKYYKKREKGLLRHALEGVLPKDVLWRKKSPYPKTHNPSYHNAVKDILQHILDEKSAPLLQLINKEAVQEMVKSDGKTFGKPWFGQLMASAQIFAYLVQVDMWLREYKVRIV